MKSIAVLVNHLGSFSGSCFAVIADSRFNGPSFTIQVSQSFYDGNTQASSASDIDKARIKTRKKIMKHTSKVHYLFRDEINTVNIEKDFKC